MRRIQRVFCLALVLCLFWALPGEGTPQGLIPAARAEAADLKAAFEAGLALLKTPAQEGKDRGFYGLHPGESAYVPDVAPEIIPFDQPGGGIPLLAGGTFESSDEAVVTVNPQGLMTARGEGSARVVYRTGAGGILSYEITVSRDVPRELAKNMAYIAQREFLRTRRARLPKYNQYARWYYGKKKEVGWCSVFTIYCANAAGANPLKKKDSAQVTAEETLYLREGQVGNQYDGFMDLDRFGGVPRVGYLVIYADMSNAYRTTHIGIVVDVRDQGGGLYRVRTVEGNMSNTVKSYVFLYDSNKDNHLVGVEKGRKLQRNMSEVAPEDRGDPLPQYELHTDHWSVFGFCETWK